MTVSLAPFQTMVWTAAATRSIASVTTVPPVDAVQHVTVSVHWLESVNAGVRSGKIGSQLSESQKETLGAAALEARSCLTAKHWWRARTLMENHELLPIYDLIGETPPGLYEYKAPPMPVSALDAEDMLPLTESNNASSASLLASEEAVPQWVGSKLLVTPDKTLSIKLTTPVAGTYSLVIGLVSGGAYTPLQVAIGDKTIGETSMTGMSPEATTSRMPPLSLAEGTQTITFSRPHGQRTAIVWMTLEPIYRDLIRSDWSTVGPFPSPLMKFRPVYGFSHIFPPEITREFTANVALSEDVFAQWSRGTGDDTYIDLFDKYHKMVDTLSYGVTYVYSPTSRSAELSYDVDYWAQLWVNGVTVAKFADVRPAKSANGRFVLDVPLIQGWNEILIKVQSGSAGNGYWAAISDPGDLKISPTPPNGSGGAGN